MHGRNKLKCGWQNAIRFLFKKFFQKIKKSVDKTVFLLYNKQVVCECAGIGRQARLRGVCLWRMGSSPITRTKKEGIRKDAPFFIPVGLEP